MHTSVELEQGRWALTLVNTLKGCVEQPLEDCVASEGETVGLHVHQLLFNMETDAGRWSLASQHGLLLASIQ